MTAVQREAIQSPATGLQIWCSDCNGGETQILMAVFGVILQEQAVHRVKQVTMVLTDQMERQDQQGQLIFQVQPITLSNLQEQQLVAIQKF
jgi:hypothetical protein